MSAEFSDSRNTMEGFIRPFVEITPEDVSEAAGLLEKGFSDLELQYPDYIITPDQHVIVALEAGVFDNDPLKGELEERASKPPASVDLHFALEAADWSSLTIIVRKYNPDFERKYTAYEPPIIMAMLTEKQSDGSTGRLVIYELRKDDETGEGVVRRKDVSDDWEEELRLRAEENPVPDFRSMSEDEIRKYDEESRDITQRRLTGSNLEEITGFNNQPVGIEEIQGLLELVERATPLLPMDSDWEALLRQQREAVNGPSEGETDDPTSTAMAETSHRVGSLKRATRAIIALLKRHQQN